MPDRSRTATEGYVPVPGAELYHGDHDFVPVACSTRVAEAVPGSQFVMLRDCGHFSYLEQPAALSATVVDFMSQR